MLRWSLAFFLVAILAAVFGFTDVAAGAAWAGKVLFFVFLACFVVSLVTGLFRTRRRRLVIRVRTHGPSAR
jgi:uncharacterized membrane protein YtjA (UPF0391 family)